MHRKALGKQWYRLLNSCRAERWLNTDRNPTITNMLENIPNSEKVTSSSSENSQNRQGKAGKYHYCKHESAQIIADS
jgi:hypothetical protein